nr:spidroin-1-like [Aegilops tauschii subsp. strangulata]
MARSRRGRARAAAGGAGAGGGRPEVVGGGSQAERRRRVPARGRAGLRAVTKAATGAEAYRRQWRRAAASGSSGGGGSTTAAGEGEARGLGVGPEHGEAGVGPEHGEAGVGCDRGRCSACRGTAEACGVGAGRRRRASCRQWRWAERARSGAVATGVGGRGRCWAQPQCRAPWRSKQSSRNSSPRDGFEPTKCAGNTYGSPGAHRRNANEQRSSEAWSYSAVAAAGARSSWNCGQRMGATPRGKGIDAELTLMLGEGSRVPGTVGASRSTQWPRRTPAKGTDAGGVAGAPRLRSGDVVDGEEPAGAPGQLGTTCGGRWPHLRLRRGHGRVRTSLGSSVGGDGKEESV